MASFRDTNVAKVRGFTPVTSDNLFSLARLINPVDLAGLVPELFTTVERHASKPKLLSLGTILRIELTSINQEGALSVDQLLYIPRIVEQLVVRESFTNTATAHFEHGAFGAVSNMDQIIDLVNFT